ncbi:MAG: YncE family protein [Elusimicrobia bacterium]|nr:YncE family protein [Elusimicrobiota bacterium]
MNSKRPILAIAAVLTLAASAFAAHSRSRRWRVEKTWRVGGPGRWDYVTTDSAHGLVYVTRQTHTLALDAETGRTIADIPGQQGSHGVALVPSAGRGFITDGKAGDVVVFDLKTHRVLGRVRTEADSDGIVYDPATGEVLVVSGNGHALIPLASGVDLKTDAAGEPLDLGGKPEFLAVDGKGRAYVNLVDKDEVAVVDTRAMKVVARWPTAPGGNPTGLAIDPAGRHLFIGCRKPAEMIVMNADTGKVLAALPIGRGVDATVFDGRTAFASSGDGTLTAVREMRPGKFAVVQVLKTLRGARTMGVDERLRRIYLPAALFGAKKNARGWPIPRPGTFRVVVVGK